MGARIKPPIVWAKMLYECSDCGQKYFILLENTLERNNGKFHKPVPFGIQCRKCGGFHCYDRSFLIPLPEERPVRADEIYFKNDKRHDYGVLVFPAKDNGGMENE